MLAAYPPQIAEGSLAQATWIDLIEPTDAERSAFTKAFELRVPLNTELREIEATSRLQIENDALYMTAPLIFASGDEPWIQIPSGFALSKRVLLTVRTSKCVSFDTVAKELARNGTFTPAATFTRIMEELVDHMADLLEATSNDLDDAS